MIVTEEMLPLRTHAPLRVEMECSKEQRTVTTATQRTMTGEGTAFLTQTEIVQPTDKN